MRYLHRNETDVAIHASAETVFAFLDDHRNLAAHMDDSSWMMLGSSMRLHADAGEACVSGSKFGFTGSILGIPLAVEEVVVERNPPLFKAWETTGKPKLWVIGAYRMGFEIAPSGNDVLLTVFINYNLPRSGVGRLLGAALGSVYARWCTNRMAGDAARHFGKLEGQAAA